MRFHENRCDANCAGRKLPWYSSPLTSEAVWAVFKQCWHAWLLPFHFSFLCREIGDSCQSLEIFRHQACYGNVRIFFSRSMRRTFDGSDTGWRRILNLPGLDRSPLLRLAMIPVFRIVDACLPDGGECIRGEFRKGLL
jgi:hypothetical protein